MKILAPFKLAPLGVSKLWAARDLPGSLAGQLNVGENMGEIWLASVSRHVSRVEGGPLNGVGLDELQARFSVLLCGENRAFPLTLKLLNVGDWLSLQVDDQQQQGGVLWHVLYADKPEIVMGLKLGAGRQEMEAAVERGNITELLAKIPVRESDTFFLPSGTVRSAGPGLLIFELGQPDNTAYRFHDWNRQDINGQPRPLHYEKAMQALNLSRHAPSEPLAPMEIYSAPNHLRLLLETRDYCLLKVQASQVYRPWWGGARMRLLFILQGNGQMRSPGGYFEAMDISAGQTWVLPARLTTPLLVPDEQGLLFLETVA